MTSLRRHCEASLGAILLLASAQVILEVPALAAVFGNQVLPPYTFFPSQLYDFLAKLRFAAEPLLGWGPGLPDSFLTTALSSHLIALATALVPVSVFMALLLGPLGGACGALLRPRTRPTWRGYLWVWTAVAVVVHGWLALGALSLNDSPSLEHLLYRSRSLVIDGTAVAGLVLVGALLLARRLGALLENRRGTARALVGMLLTAGLLLSLLPRAGQGPGLETASSDSVLAETPPNVLLISLDSLRADHLGCYGYPRNTSPNLDRLAAEGIRFENAIATSSWTLPTHLTMFTSRYQTSHGVVHDTVILDPSIPTLGEIMKAGGYSTAGFVSAPYVAALYGYSRGMDTYEDLSAAYGHRDEARSAIVAPEINTMAIDWLDEHGDEPFFLFLHYFDIHYDYIPPPPYDTMFDPDYDGDMDGRDFIERKDVNPRMDSRDLDHILALYDGEIRFTDDHVGRILAKLDQLGLRDNTLVILVSDHGEEFFEHDNKGHHRTLYDEVLKIPMILRLPDGSQAGTVATAQASLVDILPTIIDVTGLPVPARLEGLSLLDVAAATPASEERAVYGEFFDKRGFNLQVARRTLTTKVIQHFNRITHPRRDPVEFYQLDRDAAETRDLHDQKKAIVATELDRLGAWLEERWRAYRQMQGTSETKRSINLDAETRERLKSLGYVGE